LWLSVFISVAVASVLDELCQGYSCDSVQQANGVMDQDGLVCLGVDDRWRRSCEDPSVCCMCKNIFGSSLEASFICRDTRDWACNLRGKRDAASYTFVLVASIVSCLAAMFGCSAAPACSSIMDSADEPIAYSHSPPPSEVPEPQTVGPSQASDAETTGDGAEDEVHACEEKPSTQSDGRCGTTEPALSSAEMSPSKVASARRGKADSSTESAEIGTPGTAEGSPSGRAPPDDHERKVDESAAPGIHPRVAAQSPKTSPSANDTLEDDGLDAYHTEVMNASC